jgi:hypothetical protein
MTGRILESVAVEPHVLDALEQKGVVLEHMATVAHREADTPARENEHYFVIGDCKLGAEGTRLEGNHLRDTLGPRFGADVVVVYYKGSNDFEIYEKVH